MLFQNLGVADLRELCNCKCCICDSRGSLTCATFQGNVYVKCPSIPAAMSAVNALHGRFFGGELCHMTAVLFCSNGSTVFTASPVFSGKMITAAYVPLPTYHKLFPESVTATQLLVPPLRRWLNNILLWLSVRARRLFNICFLLSVNQWVNSSSSDFFFVFFYWTQRPRPFAGVTSWPFGHVITMLPVFEFLARGFSEAYTIWL